MTTVANAASGSIGYRTATEKAGASEDPDLQLARDPRADAGRLMVLAGVRPDLRRIIVDNPACSPELRTWVGRMGTSWVGPGDGASPGSGADSAWDGGLDDSLSLAPTGWEPSDIGLGDDPFGSVLGDPLMGSPLFDDGGRGDDSDEVGAVGSGDGTDLVRGGGQQRETSRRTAMAHTAVRSSTAAAPRTSAPRASSQRTRPHPAPPMPAGSSGARPGRYAQPGGQVPVSGRPAAPGYGGPGHGSYGRGPQGDPWVPGGVPGYGGPQPTVPPGPPPSYRAAGRYGASRRPGGPAPSSDSGTSLGKAVGWGLLVLIVMLIRMLAR